MKEKWCKYVHWNACKIFFIFFKKRQRRDLIWGHTNKDLKVGLWHASKVSRLRKSITIVYFLPSFKNIQNLWKMKKLQRQTSLKRSKKQSKKKAHKNITKNKDLKKSFSSSNQRLFSSKVFQKFGSPYSFLSSFLSFFPFSRPFFSQTQNTNHTTR